VCVCVCVLDGEGNRVFASRALVVVSTDGSVSGQLVIVRPVSMKHICSLVAVTLV